MIQIIKTNASDARQQLSKILMDVYREQTRILVEKSDIPVAGIISAKDLQLFTQWEEEREKRFAVVDEMREAFKNISPIEIEQEAQRVREEARNDQRKQDSAQPSP